MWICCLNDSHISTAIHIFTIHFYSFSNSSFNILLTSSIVSFSRSVLLSSSSAVRSNTLLPVSQPILFNSSMTHVSISSLNSSRSISNSSYLRLHYPGIHQFHNRSSSAGQFNIHTTSANSQRNLVGFQKNICMFSFIIQFHTGDLCRRNER